MEHMMEHMMEPPSFCFRRRRRQGHIDGGAVLWVPLALRELSSGSQYKQNSKNLSSPNINGSKMSGNSFCPGKI